MLCSFGGNEGSLFKRSSLIVYPRSRQAEAERAARATAVLWGWHPLHRAESYFNLILTRLSFSPVLSFPQFTMKSINSRPPQFSAILTPPPPSLPTAPPPLHNDPSRSLKRSFSFVSSLTCFSYVHKVHLRSCGSFPVIALPPSLETLNYGVHRDVIRM